MAEVKVWLVERERRSLNFRPTRKGRKASFGCEGRWPDACREAFPVSRFAWCEGVLAMIIALVVAVFVEGVALAGVLLYLAWDRGASERAGRVIFEQGWRAGFQDGEMTANRDAEPGSEPLWLRPFCDKLLRDYVAARRDG